MRLTVAALAVLVAGGSAHAAGCAAYGETTWHTDIRADGPHDVPFTPCIKPIADDVQAYGLTWKPHKVTEVEAANVVIYVDRLINDNSAKFATSRSAVSDAGDVVVCGYVSHASLRALYAVNFTPEGVVQHTNLEGEAKWPTIARETCANVGALPAADDAVAPTEPVAAATQDDCARSTAPTGYNSTCGADPNKAPSAAAEDSSEESAPGSTTVYARATCASWLADCKIDEGSWYSDRSGKYWILHLYQTLDACQQFNSSLKAQAPKGITYICVKKTVATWQNAD
jgi:hypothetical protein